MTPNPLPAPPPAPPPKSRWRTVALVAALLVGVPLALCLVVGGTAVLFDKTAQKTPLKAGDREALLTSDDLATAGGSFTPDPKFETAGRNALIDGSVELDYQYESKEPPLFIATTVSLEKSPQDAVSTYAGQAVSAFGLNLSDPKMKVEDRDDLLSWGDQSRARLITYDGKPVGNFFIARKGDRVFLTMFTGVYFDEPEAFKSVIEPKLALLQALQR